MKITLAELRVIVSQELNEAKKKKALELKERQAQPHAFALSAPGDFSRPLGAMNLYKSQGMANFGPYTGPGPEVSDDPRGVKEGASEQDALRLFLRSTIKEALDADFPTPAASQAPSRVPLSETKKFKSIWEAAGHWYDRVEPEKPKKKSKKASGRK